MRVRLGVRVRLGGGGACVREGEEVRSALKDEKEWREGEKCKGSQDGSEREREMVMVMVGKKGKRGILAISAKQNVGA